MNLNLVVTISIETYRCCRVEYVLDDYITVWYRYRTWVTSKYREHLLEDEWERPWRMAWRASFYVAPSHLKT
jgi:hypothetical protein